MKRHEVDLGMVLPHDEHYHFDNAADLLHQAIDILVQHCHARSYNAGWWVDPITGESLIPEHVNGEANEIRNSYAPYVLATKIALIHSEVSEMLEAVRVDANDDKLPQYKGVTAEAADVVIRVCDLIGMLTITNGDSLEYDLAGAIVAKLAFNSTRVDHSLAKRLAPGGKKF